MLVRSVLLSIGLILAAASLSARVKWEMDFETAYVMPGYNDVRIPGNTGTEFSLSKDLDAQSRFVGRIRLTYYAGEKHSLSVLAAPLRIDSEGNIDRTIQFAGEEFAAGSFIDSRYRFDSYRLTYRYDFRRNSRLNLGIGVTAKIRDAAITLWGDGKVGEKTNVGFVPLINFKTDWQIGEKTSLLLEGDALAAPQGRAEDVLFALYVKPSEKAHFKIGYRVLEGGADNDEVYNFALFHYLTIGTVWRF
ncbi:MAG: hypothetical protein AB1483_05610 [Candidatus Zixiibacteriota bacterium]